ncbi:uncharacterized protein LOC123264934 [Cotesia glomerata]|uniref:uncharacterized protein LOC123264934 n=1 Tax=Cotesia glomerata TaxID=32391 RepID=UPI001D00F937|nr:uncharacterized protein LOC123264934 [Cotesia glomerata]
MANEQRLNQKQIDERLSDVDKRMDQLKEYMKSQAEANKKQMKSTETGTALTAKKDPKTRCYKCSDIGHLSYECPRKGSGMHKCYEYNQFTKHKANECPQRLERLKRSGGSRGRGRTSGTGRYNYLKNSQGFKKVNDRLNQKRRNIDYSGSSETKKPRFGAYRGRGGHKTPNQHGQNKNGNVKIAESAKGTRERKG